ncbi:MAG: MBL fold metallo-hydrolase [Candidatus Bathyarchaeota archaeon]|nr:MBL fold metallo-hydrolase [Candidatus Bathyarchaeota archaeon]
MTVQPETTLHFLGTGGGRFVMTSQRRRTAGIRLTEGNTQVHIDPGPGALVFGNWAGLSPDKLDGLIVTHCHPDHYTDAEVFIEAMTKGTRAKRGVLAAAKSVLRGAEGIGPSISGYHQALVRDLVELYEGTSFKVGELGFTATEAQHSDPYTVGLRITTGNGNIGYTSDTGYFKGVSESYNDLKLLILCTMWPRNNPLNIHLNTDEALRIIKEAQPKACILTHFGMRMLNAGPEKEATYLAEQTGVPVYAAVDGLEATISEEITLKGPRKSDHQIKLL